VSYRWTVTAVLVPPAPVGVLASQGAATLVEDVVIDLLDGVWIRRIAEQDRSGVEVHDVGCAPDATAALRDRWTVPLRALVADTPELQGWQVQVDVIEEADDVDDEEDEAPVSPVEITGDAIADSLMASIEYEQSLLSAAELFRALPLDCLSVDGLDQADPDARGEALRYATRLAGCMVVAAEHVTDGLFNDITTLRAARRTGEHVDVDHLEIIGLLPRRFAPRYDALFAQKFLVALTDMTTRITSGWTELACVAQELAVRVWLDHVEIAADAGGVRLEEGWRGAVEDQLFEDVDHELLYNYALDGFETDDDVIGPTGMTSMRFEDWFVPYNDACTLPLYALDRTHPQ